MERKLVFTARGVDPPTGCRSSFSHGLVPTNNQVLITDPMWRHFSLLCRRQISNFDETKAEQSCRHQQCFRRPLPIQTGLFPSESLFCSFEKMWRDGDSGFSCPLLIAACESDYFLIGHRFILPNCMVMSTKTGTVWPNPFYPGKKGFPPCENVHNRFHSITLQPFPFISN